MEGNQGGSSPFEGIPGLAGTYLGKLLGAMKVDPIVESGSVSGDRHQPSVSHGTAQDTSLPAGQPVSIAASPEKPGDAMNQQSHGKPSFASVVELASSLISSAQRRPLTSNPSGIVPADDDGRELRRNRRIHGKHPLNRRERSTRFERNGSLREEDYPHIDNIFMGFVMDDDGQHDSLDFKFESLIKEWWPRARRSAANKRRLKITPFWMNRENFKRWAIRYGYRSGARLARRDPDVGWNHDNCVWVDRNMNAIWNGKEPPIEFNGESISCSHAATSGVSQVSYISLVRRLQCGLSVNDSLGNPACRSRSKQNKIAGNLNSSEDIDIALKWESMRKSSSNASGKPKARIEGIPGVVDVSGMRYFADKRRRRRIPENAKICREWKSFDSFRDWAKASGFERGAKLVRVDTSIGWNPYNCYWSYGKDCDSREKWPIPFLPAGSGEAGTEHSTDSGDSTDSGESGLTGMSVASGIRRSRKDAVMVTAFGEVKQLSDWMKDPRCVIGDMGALRARLRSGWGSERAMTEPVGKRGRPRKNNGNDETIDATSQPSKENERAECEPRN